MCADSDSVKMAEVSLEMLVEGVSPGQPRRSILICRSHSLAVPGAQQTNTSEQDVVSFILYRKKGTASLLKDMHQPPKHMNFSSVDFSDLKYEFSETQCDSFEPTRSILLQRYVFKERIL